MSLKTGTICSKHDKIKDLVKELSNYMDVVKREVEGSCDEIDRLADNCLEDGQRMEDGLDKKRREIDRLEKLVEDLEEENETLKDRVKELERDLLEFGK